MKQLALAVQMYTQDYDECLPLTMEPDPNDPSGPATAMTIFQGALGAYINNRDIWYCPSDPDLGYRNATPPMWGSYLFNGFLGTTGRSLAQVAKPAATICFAERANGWWQAYANSDPNQFYDFCYDPWEGGGNVWDGICGDPTVWGRDIQKDRHNQGSNYAFLDGHAKWLKWENTLAPDNLHDLY